MLVSIEPVLKWTCYIVAGFWLLATAAIGFLAVRQDIRNYRFQKRVQNALEHTNMEDK